MTNDWALLKARAIDLTQPDAVDVIAAGYRDVARRCAAIARKATKRAPTHRVLVWGSACDDIRAAIRAEFPIEGTK